MDNETRARIEKEANSWVDYNSGGAFHLTPSQTESYVAGATAEHSRITELLKEKDERIAELLEALEAYVKDTENHPSCAAREHYQPLINKAKAAIESLKGKQQ